MIGKFRISIFEYLRKEWKLTCPGYCKQLLIDNELKPDYVEIYVTITMSILRTGTFKTTGLFFLSDGMTDNAVLFFIE